MAPINENYSFSRHAYAMKMHHAKWLHFDLRLEHDGRLLSWALPADLRNSAGAITRAVETDVHDLKNILFEGLHNGNPIMLWDRGAWEPSPECIDIGKSHDDGFIRFTLHGERLKGQWTLRRTAKHTASGRPIWTLRKEQDQYAASSAQKCLSEVWRTSISSGRTLDEVKRDWTTGRPKHEGQTAFGFEAPSDIR